MALKVAQRGQVSPFIVMDVLRAANAREAAGADILHLEVGQPGTAAPRGVIDAAKAALEADLLGYTEALGIPALRARIAEYYRARHGVDLAPERVVVTTGSSGGFILSFLAAFDAGDRVALAAPGYPAYRNILTALDIEPVMLPATAETRFQPTVELLQRHGPLDGLIVASPSNPAGTVLPPDELEALVDYCRAEGIRLVSDEIYHGITFAGPAASAVEFGDTMIVVNSFSKYYSMTGWRIGWMVVPEALLRPIECLCQNIFVSAPTLSQFGALAAFDCREELDAIVADYAQNRELLLRELPRAGFDRLSQADGAFYIYADVSHLTNDSEAFCQRMMAETGVATAPGVDFDPENGHKFLRFSFAAAPPRIAAAAERLKGWRP